MSVLLCSPKYKNDCMDKTLGRAAMLAKRSCTPCRPQQLCLNFCRAVPTQLCSVSRAVSAVSTSWRFPLQKISGCAAAYLCPASRSWEAALSNHQEILVSLIYVWSWCFKTCLFLSCEEQPLLLKHLSWQFMMPHWREQCICCCLLLNWKPLYFLVPLKEENACSPLK